MKFFIWLCLCVVGTKAAQVKTIQWTLNNTYIPLDIVTYINPGDSIHWVVNGIHSVTSINGIWGADYNLNGTTFETTFNTEGIFTYNCKWHPTQMNGTIYVENPETTSPISSTGSPISSTGSPISSTGSPINTPIESTTTTPLTESNIYNKDNDLSPSELSGIVVGIFYGILILGAVIIIILKR